nr:hypothetical protein [Tanacetum cinerariifolium]
MANLSDDIQCASSDHDHYQEAACAHHEDHMMCDSVQLDHVVDSHADYTSDGNIILYDQYVKDNEVPVVHSDVSSIPTDAFMMIYDDMCEPHDQSVYYPSRNTAVQNSLTAELATYKEHVKLYEQRAKFELTEREQKINDQLRIVKEYQEKDKIRSKPDKNGKRGEAEKSQKQLQWIEEEKLKKTQKEGPEMQTHASFIEERRKE